MRLAYFRALLSLPHRSGLFRLASSPTYVVKYSFTVEFPTLDCRGIYFNPLVRGPILLEKILVLGMYPNFRCRPNSQLVERVTDCEFKSPCIITSFSTRLSKQLTISLFPVSVET